MTTTETTFNPIDSLERAGLKCSLCDAMFAQAHGCPTICDPCYVYNPQTAHAFRLERSAYAIVGSYEAPKREIAEHPTLPAEPPLSKEEQQKLIEDSATGRKCAWCMTRFEREHGHRVLCDRCYDSMHHKQRALMPPRAVAREAKSA